MAMAMTISTRVIYYCSFLKWSSGAHGSGTAMGIPRLASGGVPRVVSIAYLGTVGTIVYRGTLQMVEQSTLRNGEVRTLASSYEDLTFP
jgi:hypothetical protein